MTALTLLGLVLVASDAVLLVAGSIPLFLEF